VERTTSNLQLPVAAKSIHTVTKESLGESVFSSSSLSYAALQPVPVHFQCKARTYFSSDSGAIITHVGKDTAPAVTSTSTESTPISMSLSNEDISLLASSSSVSIPPSLLNKPDNDKEKAVESIKTGFDPFGMTIPKLIERYIHMNVIEDSKIHLLYKKYIS
jgi:hypothetical protein